MKRFFVLSLITSGFYLQAQTIGNSPYAAYGIGDVKYDNTTEQAAMGGIGTAYISDFTNSFNFKNPAANENLLLTSVRVDVANENNFFKSDYNNYKGNKSSTYLSNIAIAFPLSPKVKFGIGYQPYSSKRYDILTSSTDASGTITSNSFQGEGTLSTVHTAVSYQVTPEIGLGMRVNYYFGNLYDINELAVSNAALVNGYETRNRIKNFNFTAGATYQKKYDNDRKLTLGATTTFGNTSKMETIYTNSTYFYNSSSIKQYETIVDREETESKNLLPFEASFGAGFGHNLRWFMGAQLDYKKGENIQFFGNNFEYKDQLRVAAGGWVLPNANNFRNYFQRVVYRYGAYYEKGNIYLNDRSINKFAVTAGATFPFKNSSVNNMTGIDFGLEVGKRGTLQNNLINQTFVNLKFGINFGSKWFGKVLYD